MVKKSRGLSKAQGSGRRVPTKERSTEELIDELAGVWGPPGREDAVRRRIAREVSRHADRLETSPLGALHAVTHAGGAPRIMISAHMDEVAVIVSHVDPAGFARFTLLGSMDATELVSQAVGFAEGVVGVVRAEADLGDDKLSVDGLFLDFGVTSRDDSPVKTGDVGCLRSSRRLFGRRLVGWNAGSRSGLAVLTQVMRSLGRTAAEVHFVFSVQGEFGGDGGKTSAAMVDPEAAVIVSATRAGDYPGGALDPIRLGEGPVIPARHGSVACHPAVVGSLASCAKKKGIPHQPGSLADSMPGADVPSVNGGVMTAWVCIPCRGLHSASEMVDLSDIEATIRLLREFARARPEWT